jgi:Zn-dependent membrane protease YugP
MLWAVLGLAFLALVFGPQLWVHHVLARHAGDRPDYPGTGGELARHLLDRFGLQHVAVELTALGDHYDPAARKVGLSDRVLNGRSLTAVAVAAHEVGHALQHAEGQALLAVRTRLARIAVVLERIASVVLLAAPIVGLLTRAPAIIVLQLTLGMGLMASRIVLHLVTLPVEIDASFRRALPILDQGNYLPAQDMPAASSTLRAAAWTYVAAALASLLDVLRWVRVLRF